MPSILSHQSSQYTKLMLIGDSGTGKTGSLASLVTAGYKLRILDFDNGLDILHNLLTDAVSPYAKEVTDKKIDLGDAVQFITLSDPMKNVNGRPAPATARAFQKAMNLLFHWKDGEIDLGHPREWGDKTILVLDSLSFLSVTVFNHVQAMNSRLGADPVGYDWQRDIGVSQSLLSKMFEWLYDGDFKCNVILISHIKFTETEDKSNPDIRGYANTLGRALSPRIPRYFNNVLQTKTVGAGAQTKHKLYTRSQGNVDLKTSAPMRVKLEYDIHNGLAEFFQTVRGECK